MKNLRSYLFLVALVSLLCAFIPVSALAQEGGDDPCCHFTPSITTSAIQTDIQPLTNAHNMAIDAQVNHTAMPLSNQSMVATVGKATEMPVAVEESWTNHKW
jgi:C4-dicarboxylate transporter